MTLAAIYVRQSRHKDYDRTVSPEDQEAQCRALPAVTACDVIEVYRDLDLSGGTTRKRPGLLALLERVKSGRVAVVAALDQSRAFRNTADALAFYALMETRHEVRVEFVHGRFDRSAVGGFTYTTLAAAHEMERRMSGEKIASALRFMIARGEMVSKVPLGYRRIIDGQTARIEPDPEWAPVVRQAFEDYATGGFTTYSLSRRLNDGPRPPGFVAGWRPSGLTRILRSPAYIGLMPQDGRSTRAALAPGNWPALVPKEVFDAVQAVLDRHKKGGGVGPSFRAYAFKGLLRCADCGTRLYAHSVHGVAYYRCRGRGAIPGCGAAVRDDALLPWGRSLLAHLEAAKDWPDLSDARDDMLNRPTRPPDALAQIDASLERVGQRFEWGDISADDYRDKRERLLALRAEALAAETPVPRIPVAGLVEAWDRDEAAIRRALLANLFTAIELREGRIIRAHPRGEVAVEVGRRLRGWLMDGSELALAFG